jgi:epoxide hydrolase-like predicted phosphatase
LFEAIARKEVIPLESVIFDLGGVICPPPGAIFDAYALEAGLPAGSVARYFRHGSARLPDLETGHITTAAFVQWVVEEIAAEYGHPLNVESLNVALDDTLRPTDESVALVRDVIAAGRRTALLTNNTKELQQKWRSALPNGLFEVMIDSSDVGVRKPDPAAYQLVLDALGCVADACVFIDDAPVNLGTPRRMGMQVIHFESVPQCRRELGRLGVLPRS